MTLLTMCNRVLTLNGFPALLSIVGSDNPGAIQILSIANAELRALSEAFDWPQLEVEHEFTTVADQSVYDWPADFRKVSPTSVFDANAYYRIKGSTDIQLWNRYKYGLLGSVSHQRYRLGYRTELGDNEVGVPTLEFTPAPTDVRDVVALYFTNKYARNATSNAVSEMYEADTNVSRLPERLIELGVGWRLRRAKGLDYSAELAEYNNTVGQQFAAYKGSSDVPVGAIPAYEGLTDGYVPDNGFGA